ncbi:MAG: TIGR04086 family membrane protein [Oscillospiraceae bacterium]|jgi:putative membrane protein (TIGR04086 family)|nr:TIGR04086 family membrane protein [Oscillospiraceae bacterium]
MEIKRNYAADTYAQTLKNSEEKTQNRIGGIKRLAARLLVSTLLSGAFFFALLSLGSVLAWQLDLKTDTLPFLAIPLAGIAAFVAGYVGVRAERKQGLLIGALCAAILYAVLLLISMAASDGAFGGHAVALLLVMLIGGVFGGILAANSEQKKPKKRVRKRK